MSRIGIFGGSFNPIHNGHIHLAETVKKEIALDKIIIVPSSNPPHKDGSEFAPDSDRLEMCRLAINGLDGFDVSDYEICQDKVCYTVYTMRHFKDEYPFDKLFLLVGSDMLLSFDTWFRYDDILKNSALAVVSREKNDDAKLREKADILSVYGEVNIINSEPVEISSTEIRKKIKNHEKFSCYLDKKVVKYIRMKNLYAN